QEVIKTDRLVGSVRDVRVARAIDQTWHAGRGRPGHIGYSLHPANDRPGGGDFSMRRADRLDERVVGGQLGRWEGDAEDAPLDLWRMIAEPGIGPRHGSY